MPQNQVSDIFRYRILAEEVRSQCVSLVVRLLDKETKMPPLGSVRISIRDKNKHVLQKEEGGCAVKNISGDYLFFHLVPNEEYTIFVDSDDYKPVADIPVVIEKPSSLQQMKPLDLMNAVCKEIQLERKSKA